MPTEAAAPASGRQLYVYYRVADADLAACVQAVHGFQAALALAHDGLRCGLLQRADGLDEQGRHTLMETYAAAQGIDFALQQHIAHAADAALSLLVVGPRHVEVFAPCA